MNPLGMAISRTRPSSARRGILGGLATAACLLLAAVAAPSSAIAFGLASWDGDWAVQQNGSAFTQAAGHPYSVSTTFDLNTITNVNGLPESDGPLRHLTAKIPAGLVGDPDAMPTCKGMSELRPASDPFGTFGNCPVNSIVGTIKLRTLFSGVFPIEPEVPVYNMEPPPGIPAQFGFAIIGFPVLLDASVRSDGDYGVNLTTRNISQGLIVNGVTITFWGVPADPSHDIQRCRAYAAGYLGGNPFCTGTPGVPGGLDPENFTEIIVGGPSSAGVSTVRPLLTNPSECGPVGQGKEVGLDVSSWQQPSQSDSASFTTHVPGDPSQPVGNDGCEIVPFTPEITVQPGTKRADSPTGLEVNLKIPQDGLKNPDGIAQSALRKTVVSLPEGMTVNPSYADGVDVCTPQQIGMISVDPPRFDKEPASCSDASKIGDVRIVTPLLDTPVEGGLFAAQSNDDEKVGHENPFDSLVPLYIVAEGRGVRVKLAGDVALDERTGQIVTTFDNAPQIPFSTFSLSFKGGPRAPLVNPSSCGTYTSTAQFSPWSRPDQPVTDSDPFTITSGPGGGPCVNAPGNRPFNPVLRAGTLNPSAGSFSPFVLRMSRNDGEQEVTSFESSLPAGLVASLAGTSKCPDAAIALAATKTGKAEKASPSCPASSRIGTALSGTGSGQILTYVPGTVYLAGPYNGAPLSVATIVPAAVGPFDVGTIVVRAALRIDPETAKVSVDPVPIPYIRSGIALHVRDIRVILDKPNFTLNPTSCDPKAVTARMLGTGADFANPADDVAADLSERFQVANCAALPFKPKLSFNLKGGTKRGQFPAFQATLLARPGDANLAKTTVVLPRSEFIEQGHIRTVCTRPQFKAQQCPAGSIYGYAKAITPLFDTPVEGPVYLRANGGERVLPDLVVSLKNGEIEVALAGFIDSVKGRVRNAFNVIPDAPVTKFTLNMLGGKKGLLVNHLDLCEVTSRADVKMVGQNGKVVQSRPKMGTSCKGKGRRGTK